MRDSFAVPEKAHCPACHLWHEPPVPDDLADADKGTAVVRMDDGFAVVYRDVAYYKVKVAGCDCAMGHRLRWCAALERWREEAGKPIEMPLSQSLEQMNKRGAKIGIDFAPLSFSFEWVGMWGGLILHGSHDGGGSGGDPSFSVCLSPTDGWAMHT